MRRIVLSLVALAAIGGSALAMGAGGYRGGGMPMMPHADFDDYSIALRLIKAKEFAHAIPHLETALRQRPKDADILNYLGYSHRMVGADESGDTRDKDFQASLDFYQAALAINPAHRGVHEYLGELFLQMNNLNAAHDQMNLLVLLCPDGCDERDALKKALAAYVPPAAAAPGPAQTPAANP